jgi:Tol biopolymer transport system component
MSSNGGSPGPSFPLEFEGGATGFPTFEEDLPDGRGVLTVLATWGPRGYREDIWLLDAKTGKGRRLVENASNVEYQAETGHLLFSRQSALMAVRFDLATQTVQGDLIALFDGLRSAAWSNGGFRISHAGHLFFQPGGRIAGDRRLVVVSPNNQVTSFVSDARPYEADLDASADGTRVSVVVPTAGGTYETWTATAGRPGVRRTLSAPNADVGGSFWSPDGQWLAFTRVGRDADDGVYVQRSDGSGPPRAVRKHAALGDFAWVTGWTADGRALFVNQVAAGRSDIMLLPVGVDGTAGELRPLRATSASEFDARVSPDGRLIAFVSDESGTNELYVAEFANDAIVGQPLLLTGGDGGSRPRWSSDSRRLFFARAVPNRIMSVTVERSAQLRASEPVLAFDPGSLRLDQNVWTILPGDRLLGIELGAGEGPVRSYQLILNWLDTVRGRLPAR